MNIAEYISSGILESYALGELSDAERAEVEKNLSQYPELRKELALIEETMEVFFMKAGRKPQAVVKERILLEVKPREAKVVNLNAWKYAAAASIVVALSASLLAYTYYGKWKESETSLLELRAFNQQMAQDYNQVNQRLDDMETGMKVMGNPAFHRVVMKGTNNSPEAMASVYWNQSTAETYLSIQNLKALAQEQQYQLWAIVDGVPVDMGVFDSFEGLHKMKDVPKAAAFAVTIEPRGGKPSPTMETMQVVGNT
ncbi:MAG TPA: anti-sigma factor [Cyclobacteriaceae bacterium]|nr:anti-sigma factor [Cyclobacteriaceae bacterium]